MAVFRVERNKGYTVMSNHHLRNKELTLKAKGLLSQMLSLPEDWDYTLAGLSQINRESIAVSLLCACNCCFSAAAWYTMKKRKMFLPVFILWGGVIFAPIFLVRETVIICFIAFTSMLISFLRLLKADAYVFYHPVPAKLLIRHTKGTGSIFLYLLRYLITNKNYLLNTAGLCVIAGVMPFILGQFEGVNVMPLGFAVLCLNTPICILLSCDPDLEQAVRTLPGQAKRFCTNYCFFIFSINMAVNSVYLISWQIGKSGVNSTEIIIALIITLQSAILSVLLEWFCPVRNWKIENDLWHHPRKYIVPLIMFLVRRQWVGLHENHAGVKLP